MFRTVGVKIVRANFSIETRESSFTELQKSRDSISSVIDQLLDKFSFADSVPAVRKAGLRVTNLVSMHKDQVKMQKSILDYVSLPSDI
jgi:DNA polymerase IV (archaeal DinB-like DNA polymerase)